MENKILKIHDLHAKIEEKEILKGVDLELEKGKIYALMGPNGSGKSTLSQVLMGSPEYEVERGEVLYFHENTWHNILDLSPDERAKMGIFLAFQYPVSIPGVSVGSFLRQIYNTLHPDKKLTPLKFKEYVKEKLDILNMDESYIERFLNDGFSGGEKKKTEILQMMIVNPKLVILDETDSGLDIDALRHVSSAVNAVKKQNTDMTILIITHYQRILNYIKPDHVSIMKDGRISLSGGYELVEKLEKEGYKSI